MIWKTVGRVRAGLIAGGTAATLAEGGAADGEDSAEAAGADGERMASMTFSGTPFFLSAISASVRTSKFVGLVRIFATMTRSESPALTISTTDWFVRTSCARTQAAGVMSSEPSRTVAIKKGLMATEP